MTTYENLMITASEECSEIQKEISKALRFGLDNHAPNENETNEHAIIREYYELQAVMEMLFSEGYLKDIPYDEKHIIKKHKKKKVKFYLAYSESIGTMKD